MTTSATNPLPTLNPQPFPLSLRSIGVNSHPAPKSRKCWGRGEGGQLGTESILTLGDDPSELGNALGAVNLGSGVASVDVTAGQQHTCALLDTGAIKCWGKNFYGNLGIGNFRAR